MASWPVNLRQHNSDHQEHACVKRMPNIHSKYGSWRNNAEVKKISHITKRSSLGRELQQWSARNSSKGALMLESIKCLQFLAAGHSIDELRHAIQNEDLLGKRTWEVRRTYWRLISWRYLTPPHSPVVSALSALACRGADDPILRGALYFHFCLADRLTFDIATDLLWVLQHQGREIISSAEVEAFIRSHASSHPEVLNWSVSTFSSLVSNILSALRDFGRMSGRAKKRLARPPLPDEMLLYICKFLSNEGASAREIVEAPEFRLWGRDPHEVGTHLSKLSRTGVVRFEWSGDIAILDIGEETFDAYARRLGQQVR
jgi:hypothetical protein